jgi:predicted transcriptional regulator
MAKRKGITRPLAAFTLSPEAVARLVRLAKKRRLPRSRVIEQLIFAASLEEP